jgi:hypothetical protein
VEIVIGVESVNKPIQRKLKFCLFSLIMATLKKLSTMRKAIVVKNKICEGKNVDMISRPEKPLILMIESYDTMHAGKV